MISSAASPAAPSGFGLNDLEQKPSQSGGNNSNYNTTTTDTADIKSSRDGNNNVGADAEREDVGEGSCPEGEGWAEYTDPDTGAIYYYNHLTGESSWGIAPPEVES